MMRPATADEGKAIARFFEGIQEGLSIDVFGDEELALVERAPTATAPVDGDPAGGADDRADAEPSSTAVCLVSPDLLDAPAAIHAGCDHAGLRIGTWEDGHFHLDLQGAVRMAGHTRKQMIRVSEQSARLFLYGRDILGTSVKSFDPRLNAGDVCIVCNPRWEAIGMGEVMGRFKGDRPVVTPIHDLGAYLRDQH